MGQYILPFTKFSVFFQMKKNLTKGSWTDLNLLTISYCSVVLGMDTTYSICLSAAIALFYTVIGGLYSVAYTGKRKKDWLTDFELW